jgi:hypothetical protein
MEQQNTIFINNFLNDLDNNNDEKDGKIEIFIKGNSYNLDVLNNNQNYNFSDILYFKNKNDLKQNLISRINNFYTYEFNFINIRFIN